MSDTPDIGAIRSSADLLAVARVMDERSAERYRELAVAFEMSCNIDTAAAFHELADDEDRHMAEFPVPAGAVPAGLPWGEQDPEIADPDAVHYLMHPWHAVDLALRHEERSLAFFVLVAESSTIAEVRAEAARLAERERGHVALIKARREALPLPPDDWDEDQDPPNWEASD